MVIRNDAKCKVEGKGTILFQSNDGISKNLSDVIYGLDIKRNLLSKKKLLRNLKYDFP